MAGTLKDFKKELKELLKKYDASIGLEADESSDFYGITGAEIVVNMNNKNYHLSSGYSLDYHELS